MCIHTNHSEPCPLVRLMYVSENVVKEEMTWELQQNLVARAEGGDGDIISPRETEQRGLKFKILSQS